MTAATDRLARSRAALADAMSSPDAPDTARRERQGQAAHGNDAQPGAGGPSGLLDRLRRAWEAHPAHLAVEVAGPMLARWSARHPQRLLALAALLGAALVLARPWRLLPAGALGALAWRAGLRAGSKVLGLPALLLPILMRMRQTSRTGMPEAASSHRPSHRP